MHAKGETVDQLPTFAPSFHAGRRGIMRMRTLDLGEEVGKKVVQHVLTPPDGVVLGGACVFDLVPGADGAMVPAFVMVTTEPNPLIASVTDRMPALLAPEDRGAWLGEGGATGADAKAVLRTYSGALAMTPQSKAVRSSRPLR